MPETTVPINVLKAYYQTSPLIIHGSYVCPIIKKKKVSEGSFLVAH